MTRVTLQFRSTQMCRGAPFIVDDASAHAVGFILAQKDGAVAGIGDTGWPVRAFGHGRHHRESFRGYNFPLSGLYSVTVTGVPTDAFSKNGFAIPLGKRMQPCDAAKG